jgi:polysaccharide deacetylase family protein (PEP-CTERM system associated)
MPITFTIDMEDHLDTYAPDGRWVRNARRLLEFCTRKKIRATFFAVGKCAVQPELLREITGGGHELALHSYDHVVLTKEDAKAYRPRLAAAKKTFEDITGKKVTGFRAPVFSLTPGSAWVLEDLARLEFLYSSSIIPGQGMFSGYPGVPDIAFRWGNGLVELPVPAMDLGGFSLPFLGGVYLKLLPLSVVNMAIKKQANPRRLFWTYTHPYDIDAEEGFVRLQDGTPYWANMLLMQGRGGFLKKLEALLDNNAAPPLVERVTAPGFTESLAVFRSRP